MATPAVPGHDEPAFAEGDPYGFMMALIGMVIVFSALILLYLIFSNTPILFTQSFKNRFKAFLNLGKLLPLVPVHTDLPPKEASDLTGEVNAAIAAAIHLYRSELHDHENTVLTIKKVSRTYSPWSSKIYSLRNFNMFKR